jgi:hypothetical protein
MTWHRTTDVEQYLAAVGDLLLSEPWRHSVALTVVEDVRATPDGTVFAWWDEGGGDVTGAVSQTPPYALLLSVVPDHAVGPLVELLAPERVNGPTALAAQVAAVAARAAGGTAVLRSAQRLHRLAALVEPDAPGAARIAGPKDLDLVVDWFRAFVEETGVTAGAVEDRVRERLALDGYVLWEDDAPVAMAGRTRLDAAGAPRPRLRRGGDRGRHRALVRPGRHRRGPVHRPDQPDEQRPVRPVGLPAGRRPRRAAGRDLLRLSRSLGTGGALQSADGHRAGAAP